MQACAVGGCGMLPSAIGDGNPPGNYIDSLGPIALDATCVYWSTYSACQADLLGAYCSPGIWKAAK